MTEGTCEEEELIQRREEYAECAEERERQMRTCIKKMQEKVEVDKKFLKTF